MTRRRPPPSPRRSAPQKSSKRTRYMWFVIVFVLVFGAAFVAFDFFSQNQSTLGLPTASASQNVVFEGTVVVEPNRFEAFEFEIDTATMADVVLTGDFSATGGSGHDIVVLVMDEIDYRNWLSDYETSSVLYKSTKITADHIEIPLTKSGRYYLVFDNKFSIVSNKVVEGKISIIYNP